jgi:hypothetical protein
MENPLRGFITTSQRLHAVASGIKPSASTASQPPVSLVPLVTVTDHRPMRYLTYLYQRRSRQSNGAARPRCALARLSRAQRAGEQSPRRIWREWMPLSRHFPMHNHSMEVPLLDGRQAPIRDLAGVKGFWVDSFDPGTRAVVPGRGHSARMTMEAQTATSTRRCSRWTSGSLAPTTPHTLTARAYLAYYTGEAGMQQGPATSLQRCRWSSGSLATITQTR